MTPYDAVVVDPGHGGLDPETGEYQTHGKRYTHTDVDPEWTFYEGEHNRRHSARLIRMLLDTTVDVYSTVDQRQITQPPSLDGSSFGWRDTSLTARIRYANSLHHQLARADKRVLLVSIHGNAIGSVVRGPSQLAKGLVVFTSRGATQSDRVAESITDAYAADPSLGMRVRRPKEANFKMLTATRCPAVLLEAGFFTNLADAQVMASEEGSEAIARGVFRGLVPMINDQ